MTKSFPKSKGKRAAIASGAPALIEHADATDEQLEAIAKNIETLAATAALQVGAELAKARDIFRYRRDEGGFAGWVETRLGYSRHTAYNLLHVHEQFGGQEVSKCLDTLGRSVLFLISAPGTPPEARAEIIERAEAGEKVSVEETKHVVERHKDREQPARRGPRHVCWQCRQRGVVGEVKQHSYADYEDVDVWLHDSCVAALEYVQSLIDELEMMGIVVRDGGYARNPQGEMRAEAVLIALYVANHRGQP